LRRPAGSFLDFNRYGGTYFLRRVWEQENPSGLEIARTHAEKEIARGTNVRDTVGVALQRQ
jgi:hypothetical protein